MFYRYRSACWELLGQAQKVSSKSHEPVSYDLNFLLNLSKNSKNNNNALKIDNELEYDDFGKAS